MTVLFVRHAHAGDRDNWEGDDRRRPLTPKGWRQADAIVGAFDTYDIRRIYSSPFARCAQTVEPLGDARGIAVEEVEALAEGHGADGLSLLDDGPGAIVLCGHGDNIPEMLAALGVTVDRCQKGSTWVVSPDNPPLYLPPSD